MPMDSMEMPMDSMEIILRVVSHWWDHIESSFQYYYCGENLQVGTWSHEKGCLCTIEYVVEESIDLELYRVDMAVRVRIF